MIPAKFLFIWLSGFIGEDFFRNQPIIWKVVLCKDCSFRPDPLTNMAATDDSCFWLVIPAKFLFIWLSGFIGEDFFRNQPIRNKNYLWRPCLLTDRDKMSKLYRGPSIDASYQISVHPGQNESKLGGKHLWKVLYKECSFTSDPLTNMAATGHSCFWLVDF
jgi:hypothetical protein